MAEHRFNKDNAKELGSKGGKASKRKPLDAKLLEMAEKLIGDGSNKTRDDIINENLLLMAEDRDLQAMREYFDRVYGKAPQSLKVEADVKQDVVVRSSTEADYMRGDDDKEKKKSNR